MSSRPDRVLATFVDEAGRWVAIPRRKGKRRVLLDSVVQRFEPGRHYTEVEVDDILRDVHADVAALRRYLVDEELLDRAAGEYWRCGGPLEPAG